MKAWTQEDNLHRALAAANDLYGGNLRFKRVPEPANQKATAWYFTLSVHSTKALGTRIGHSGRKIAAACWHAHRDFLNALFRLHDKARVKTAKADYKDKATFERIFPATGYQNIGSEFQPMSYHNACECDE
jgi:hypothetical protein